MIGFNLHYVPRERDEQTGEEWDGEPVFLHLSYGTNTEATAAQKVLETLYGVGRIEIDVKANYGTFVPGEGA